MIEIPQNNTKDEVLENAVKRVLDDFAKGKDYSQITREFGINKEQAIKLCGLFKSKGYHHEIRMHSNTYGRTFFYCVNISKTPIRSSDAMMAWSEYVA